MFHIWSKFWWSDALLHQFSSSTTIHMIKIKTISIITPAFPWSTQGRKAFIAAWRVEGKWHHYNIAFIKQLHQKILTYILVLLIVVLMINIFGKMKELQPYQSFKTHTRKCKDCAIHCQCPSTNLLSSDPCELYYFCADIPFLCIYQEQTLVLKATPRYYDSYAKNHRGFLQAYTLKQKI